MGSKQQLATYAARKTIYCSFSRSAGLFIERFSSFNVVAAGGNLFVSLKNGKVVCFGK
jgi:hypothetical protein